MLDGFTHLDLTAQDPILDLDTRLKSVGLDGAVLVETWKGDDFTLLNCLRASAQDRFQLAFCFRPENRALSLLDDAGVFAMRVRGSDIGAAGDLIDLIDRSQKYLLVHSDEGIGSLSERVLGLLKSRPRLKVYFPHLAWPVVGAREDPDWKKSIVRLAATSNVVVGISAIHHFSTEEFPHSDVKLYAEEILTRFPPHRLIAGSDYPMFDTRRYFDYMDLAFAWIRERYPDQDNRLIACRSGLATREMSSL